MANGNFGGGNGLAESPYIVEDAQDLNAVRNHLSAHYRQTKDIDLRSFPNWKPIHDYSTSLAFTGVYDGSAFTIENLSVESGENYLALFGYCDGAKLKNINIRNADVKPKTGSVDAHQGAILATVINDCEVINCTTQGKVLLGVNGSCSASGFIAIIQGNSLVEKCAAIDVTVSGANVGLFCFTYTGNSIKDCYAEGNLFGFNDTYYGLSYISGFSAFHYNGVIENCYANAKISYAHDNERAPSVSVFSPTTNRAFLINCFADVEKYGPIQWEESRSYNTKTHIKGTDGNIYTCINNQPELDYYFDPSWNENGPPSWWPGPFTRAQPTTGEIYTEYWQLDHSSESKTTQEMKIKSTFKDWDFDSVWSIEEGVSYPTFKIKRAIKKCKRMPLTNYRR